MNQILLKVDDFLSANTDRRRRELENFNRFLKIVKENDAKFALGIIGATTEKLAESEIKSIKDNLGTTIELFNHSYHHVLPDNIKFQKWFDALKDTVLLCNDVIKDRFGVECKVFGAPANYISLTMLDVLKEHAPAIEKVFLMRESDMYPYVYSMKKVIDITGYRELENIEPNSNVQWDNFIAKYKPDQSGLKVYQMHPMMWRDSDFEVFDIIMRVFKKDGKEFVFPSEV